MIEGLLFLLNKNHLPTILLFLFFTIVFYNIRANCKYIFLKKKPIHNMISVSVRLEICKTFYLVIMFYL